MKMYIKRSIVGSGRVGTVIHLTFAKNCDFRYLTVKPKIFHLFRIVSSIIRQYSLQIT